jgi:O-antigen ligase
VQDAAVTDRPDAERDWLDRLAPLALAIGLALPAILPEVTNIAVLCLAGLALLTRSDWQATLSQISVQLVMVSLAIIAACSVINSYAPDDIAAFVIFAPLIAVVPLARLFRRNPGAANLSNIALAASAGAVLALCVGLWDGVVLGMDRAGFSVNNPVHFGAIALVLGLVAAAGLYSPRNGIKAIAVIGVLASLWAVLLSGTRGAMVAAVPSYLVLFAMLGIDLGRGRQFRIAIVAVGVLGIVALGIAAALGLLEPMLDLARRFVSGEVDASTAERLALYRGAWEAFLAAPLWGHGIADMMGAAIRHGLPETIVPPYEHLHSDIADFAVIGGIAGLIAYAALLAAPLLAGIGSGPGPARYLAAVVPVAWLTLGLTNPMIGILTQTVLFAVLVAIITALASGRAR